METENKTSISLVLPCYNEEAILYNNLNIVIKYLRSKEKKYQWEIVLVNDGSKDQTGNIAEQIAGRERNVSVIHHPVNLNLGRALQTGFYHAKGEIIVVMDVDLSYSVDHIEQLIDTLILTMSDIVIASPYMKGGKVTAVPFSRKVMSKWVNKIMRITSGENIYTFTGMVRAYRSSFIRSVNLKTTDYEVNPEIIYKAVLLRARIIEIPAHLDWTEQNKFVESRTSSMRVFRGFFSGLMSAFIFRPYFFFMGIGAFLLSLSLYQLIWLLYDTLTALKTILVQMPNVEYPFSYSLVLQFQKNPQTFIVGGITFIAAIQFLSLGFISLQNKRYFEELFHLETSIRNQNENIISLRKVE
jgi:dolichol-phosphate mannosyltransferase